MTKWSRQRKNKWWKADYFTHQVTVSNYKVWVTSFTFQFGIIWAEEARTKTRRETTNGWREDEKNLRQETRGGQQERREGWTEGKRKDHRRQTGEEEEEERRRDWRNGKIRIRGHGKARVYRREGKDELKAEEKIIGSRHRRKKRREGKGRTEGMEI